MPHIHKIYDFVVSVFIVHRKRVLMVYHKSYDRWLPIGGHIELNEDPEEALMREIREECGLKVRILAGKPRHIAHRDVKPILIPTWVDVHRIKGPHQHIAFIYVGTSESPKVRLHEREHREYQWLSREDLVKKKYGLSKSIRFYCREALRICENRA